MNLLTRFWGVALLLFVSVGSAQDVELMEDAEMFLNEFSKQPKDTVAMRKLFEQANAWYEADKYSDALKLIETFVETDSLHADAHLLKGIILHDSGDYENAILALSKSLELQPRSAYGLFLRAVSYQQLDQQQRAVDDLDKAVLEDPDNTLVYFHRAKSLMALGCLDPAWTDLDRASEDLTLLQGVLLERARILRAKGQRERALEVLDSIKTFAADYEVIEERFINLYEGQRYEEALQPLEQLLEIDPNDDFDLFRKGVMLQFLERYEEAVLYYDRAISLNPDPDYRLERARCYYLLNREEEAITALDQLIKEDPTRGNYYLLRGLSIQYSEQEADGCADFVKALELGDPEALQALQEFCWE